MEKTYTGREMKRIRTDEMQKRNFVSMKRKVIQKQRGKDTETDIGIETRRGEVSEMEKRGDRSMEG